MRWSFAGTMYVQPGQTPELSRKVGMSLPFPDQANFRLKGETHSLPCTRLAARWLESFASFQGAGLVSDQDSVKVWLVEEEGFMRPLWLLRVGKPIHNKPSMGMQLTNADVYCALPYILGGYVSLQSNSSKSEPNPCVVPIVEATTCVKNYA